MLDLETTGIESFDLILKSRSKSIDKWKKLQHVASHLEGKSAADITFTSSHPSYGGEPVQHTLGSSVGNLHFLLGYVNPQFHVAPYHWVLVDPFISPEDIPKMEHPARSDYWEKSGLGDVGEEGDLKEGNPHPDYAAAKERQTREDQFVQEAVQARGGYAEFVGFPSTGMFFDVNTGRPYRWEHFQNSLFARRNPEFAEAMNQAVPSTEDENNEVYGVEVPETVIQKALDEHGDFAHGVYPLVQSCFPEPGSIVPIEGDSEEIYAVIGSERVHFFGRRGEPAYVQVFDDVYKSFDLREDGELHYSILLNFAVKYLRLSKALISPFIEGGDVVDLEPESHEDDAPAPAPNFNWRRLFNW